MLKSKDNIKQNESIIDMQDYRLPGSNPANIIKLHTHFRGNFDKVGFDIYDYELLFNDEATRQLMRRGDTIGCFYIESPGMRSLLKRLNCDTFEMLTAASSVIRPGVAESGMMQEFIDRHKQPAKRKYLIPEMEEFLGETYGVMIYQEDVIKVVHHVVGMSLEEADLLRRAMSGKMRSHSAMQQLINRFFQCCDARGYSKETAQALWDQIDSFAGYAFCKAHSASFALLSFQVAFLKTHYPPQFMANVLNNGGGYYSAEVYINESKRMGIKILLPSINESQWEYKASRNSIRLGFLAIKGFDSAFALKIVRERNANGKFVSLADFIVRTGLGYEHTKKLIACGALDSFKETRPTLMRLIDIYYNKRKILDNNYNDLFMNESFKLEEEIKTSTQYSIEEICSIEYEIFGYMVSRHPLHFFHNALSAPDIVRSADLKNHKGKRIKMIGWYMASKRIKTKNGEIMKFLSLEDLSGTFEAIFFPKTYNIYAEQTISTGPYLLEGKADLENGNNIIVQKLRLLSSMETPSVTRKDSSENNYFGDVEKVSEEEFALAAKLDREKLRRAYAI
ncbi:MAG: hypothetical protein M0P71_04235 [Melioribacteraceae bacterium]|nr:hypothetical protein [Melioribacteraceae bacterium]